MALEPVWTLRADVQASFSRMAEVSPLGSYIVRSVAFTDAVRAPAWLESEGTLTAHLYADELAALEPGAQGIFSPAIAPAVHVRAVLSPDTPSPWDCCTSRVHFHLDADAANAPMLRLGLAGWLRLAPKFRHAVMVPSTAVLQSPAGPYVFVASADRRSWVPRAVSVGKVLFGNAVVVSGVREQESVAVNGLFFADAERRLRRDPGIGPAP
jgi:multidrug efflux pump subunit AcrA (membrane-fusion protein)